MKKVISSVAIITTLLLSTTATPGTDSRREKSKKLKDIEQAPIVSPN